MARHVQTEAERQRKRRRILDCAASLSAQKGAEASVAEIARAAGISPGTVYLYFSNRREISETLCLEALETLDRSFDEALSLPAPDLRARLCLIFFSYLRFFGDHRDQYDLLRRSLSAGGFGLRDERVQARTAAVLQRLEAPLVDGVLHGVIRPCDTGRTARTVWAMLDGALCLTETAGAAQGGAAGRAYASGCIDLILNGLFV